MFTPITPAIWLQDTTNVVVIHKQLLKYETFQQRLMPHTFFQVLTVQQTAFSQRKDITMTNVNVN